MGSSKSSTHTDMGPWKPTQQPLIEKGIPRIEEGYQRFRNDPLIPQAQDYTSRVLGGEFLTPENNPYLMNYANTAMRQFQSGQNTLMARAGRGNLTGGDMQQQMGQGMMGALVSPMLQQYNIERGYQDAASRQAPLMAAAGVAPEEWYTGQMANLARLGQEGTTTTTSTPSIGSTIGGIGLTALGAFTGNPALMAGGMGTLAGNPAAGGGGGGGQGSAMAYYAQNPAWSTPTMPWMTGR